MVLKKVYLILGEKMDEKLKIRLKQLNFFKKNTIEKRLAASGWDKDWKTLIAIMLSAQTRDETTIKIANNLFNKFKTLKKLSEAKYIDVFNILKSVNYNKSKTKHVLACAKILVDDYDLIVPKDFDKLVLLPGVGRKTANVFLAQFGGANIGVDTHVAYISTRMGWTKSKTQKGVENDLKELFPAKYWSSLNNILVSFGRSYTSKQERNKLIDIAKKIK